MKNNERIAVLEQQVKDLTEKLNTLGGEYVSFIEEDRKWSERVRDALVDLMEFKRNSITEINKGRVFSIIIAERLGLDEKDLLEAVAKVEAIDGEIDSLMDKLKDTDDKDEIDKAITEAAERLAEEAVNVH